MRFLAIVRGVIATLPPLPPRLLQRGLRFGALALTLYVAFLTLNALIGMTVLVAAAAVFILTAPKGKP